MGWRTCWITTDASIILMGDFGSNSNSNVSKRAMNVHTVLDYSMTLHAPGGTRLVGFDNAHQVPAKGSRFKKAPKRYDHWHRTETDTGRPYKFTDAATLIEDFYDEVKRVLDEHGVKFKVIGEE